MAMTDEERVAANALLVSRMQAWAAFEDASVVALSDEVVARKLPRLLGLAQALPRRVRSSLLFPPIGGGPQRAGS